MDLQDLQLHLTVNGKTRQHGSTADMLFEVRGEGTLQVGGKTRQQGSTADMLFKVRGEGVQEGGEGRRGRGRCWFRVYDLV